MLNAPKKIVVLGNAGSGKSTLARTLGKELGYPVIHLDKLFWGPNWTKKDKNNFRTAVRDGISQSSWICEGNYHKQTFDIRLPLADLIIWLNTHRLICVRRVATRSLLNKPREDLPSGCAERIDGAFIDFIRYVWKFDQEVRPLIENERQIYGPNVPVLDLNSEKHVLKFIDDVRCGFFQNGLVSN
ncbi:AAA family ATPase [Methylorubrum populi]|uniref:AAA family ATPase n=1 Tax=Methylorubrum populi TaxID=223967 RepID=UPI0031F84FA9